MLEFAAITDPIMFFDDFMRSAHAQDFGDGYGNCLQWECVATKSPDGWGFIRDR
jgi:hypothetical protein